MAICQETIWHTLQLARFMRGREKASDFKVWMPITPKILIRHNPLIRFSTPVERPDLF